MCINTGKNDNGDNKSHKESKKKKNSSSDVVKFGTQCLQPEGKTNDKGWK